MGANPYFWNALGNMVFYVATVIVQYKYCFLAWRCSLNADIRARKFFCVAFLLPFMLSPVAVSWMIGKSLLENRFGRSANFARFLGWENPAFFSDPVDCPHDHYRDGRLGLDPVYGDPPCSRASRRCLST